MMSTYSRITDDEMRYFQFKARQRFLIRKEDHDWNEFCKINSCTCCSCQPADIPKPLKDIGIQVSSKAPLRFGRSTYVKAVQDKALPDSLSDIKTKLEKIELALSEAKQIPQKDYMQRLESISSDSRGMESGSALDLLTEQRKNLIKNSLMTSLHRLQSFAVQKSKKPLSSPYIKNRNSSFFLPHDLQKQRLVARKAYLASLTNKPKVVNRKAGPSLNVKKSTVGVESNKRHNSQTTNMKPRKNNSIHITRPKEQQTLIQSDILCETKDENIERAVDGIIDDLLREEILSLSRIRQRKTEKLSTEEKNYIPTKSMKKEVHLHKLSPEASAKIRQNPFFNLKMEKIKNSKQSEKNTSCNHEHLETPNGGTDSQSIESQLQNISDRCDMNSQMPSTSEMRSKTKTEDHCVEKKYQVLQIHSKIAEAITRQRKLYWQYLEKISRTRTHNFDPWTLSNMVAESLLDDCIADVCEELGDVPISLITDLINQEFMPAL